MHTHTSPEQPAGDSRTEQPNPARVYRSRGRAAAKRAARTRAATRSHTRTVAFVGTADAHTVAQNPNRAKRHAAPASTREPRTSNRTRTEPRVTLKTWSSKQPSLPPIISKNVPRAHARGTVLLPE